MLHPCIIGIDCATQPEKVGLALARLQNSAVHVEEIAVGSSKRSPAEIVTDWLTAYPSALLALDAPLGWPAPLGPSLVEHTAGQPISASPHKLFRRCTDVAIYQRLHKLPLEVGANLIARTAHAALVLLEEVRLATGHPIPLAWDPANFEGTVAIEVYPAATLLTRGFSKGLECLKLFESSLRVPDTPLLATSEHAHDAVLCVLSGADFLAGECVPPDDLERARKEGWIWARRMPV